jgi:2-polyprenyl-3-methyl-5-hydroxy-6-metoxy-1,4-benzoquinol methylase
MSLDYYNAHAQQYFDGTVLADVGDLRERFLQHVAPGGAILDAGCGSGRDARAFAELGYEVTAFDASEEMVRLARRHSGLPVQQLAFADINWLSAFDGIWASASLLHVPREELVATSEKIARALRPGGAWYLSMKFGQTTRYVEGRSFTDVTGDEIRALVDAVGLQVIDFWFSDDVRPGRSDRWVNVIAVSGEAEC